MSISPLKKQDVNIELGIILLVQILLIGAVVTDIYAAVPWLSVTVTLMGLWLLPGYILWRLTGPESLPAWFYWLPVSFGLGRAWLMIPGLIVFFFELNMALLVKITFTGNSLLAFLYIILRFTGRLPWPVGKKSRDEQLLVNWWLVAGAVITLIIILYLYLDAVGLSFNNDITRLMGQVRELLITPQFNFTARGISLWNYITALVVSVSGVNLLDTYILYLSVFMIIVAVFNQLVLSHTLFQDKNKAYFALIIFGVYFISDVDYDSKGEGVGLFFRLMEDKYVTWLLILPLAQIFFLRFLQTTDNRFLPLFGLMSLTAVLIHPIAVTWLSLSIGGVWLMHFIFQPNRRMLYAGLFVIGALALLLMPFGFWTAIPGLEKGVNLPSVDPLNGLRQLVFHRVLVLSAADNQYMVHPMMLSHPLVIAAITISPVLFFRLRRSLAAQFLFSNIVVVLLLLFNPITAPLIGSVVQYWQIYRIVWMLPVSLTLAYILYDCPQYAARLLKYRSGSSRITDFFIRLAPLLIALLIMGLLRNYIILSVRTLYAWRVTVVSTTAERELASFITNAAWPEGSLAAVSEDNLFTHKRLPLQVPHINFNKKDFQNELVDHSIFDYLQKNQVDYLIINRSYPIEGYLLLMPDLFPRLFRNSDYSVYAWSPEALTPTHLKLLEANQAFNRQNLEKAQKLFQEILIQQPDYSLALVGLGLTLADMGKDEEALVSFRQAALIAPTEPFVQLKLVRAMQDAPAVNWDEVFALYQNILYLDPEGNWVYRKVLANFQLFPPDKKNTAEANALADKIISYFQAYAQAEPRDLPRQQQLADVYHQLGDLDSATAQYERMKQLFPGEVDPYFAQANLYLAQGDFNRATQVYLQAIDNQPQPEIGQLYFNLADIYRNQQNYEQALAINHRFAEIASHPGNLGNVNLQLARIYREMGQMDQAEHYYLQALGPMAYHAPAYILVGEFYESQGNLDQAISYYRQAITLQPKIVEYYYALGAVLQKSGKLYECLEVLRDALTLNPKADKTNQLLGETLLMVGESQEAVDYLKKAIALAPQNEAAQSQLSQALTQIERQAELPQHWFDTGYADMFSDPTIAPILKEAMAEGSITRETFLNLLARQVITDQSATIETFLRAMIQILPSDEDLYFYLAEMYRYRGDFEGAKENYNVTLKLNPDYSSACLKSGLLAETMSIKADAPLRQQYLKESLGWYQQYHTLKPADPLGLKKQLGVLSSLGSNQAVLLHQQLIEQISQSEPQTVVNQTLESGWVFMGYSGDQTALAQGKPTALWLFWQSPPGKIAGQESDGWYSLGGNRWVQSIDEAQNLLINGDFESGLTNGSPTGFPVDIYQAPPETRRLEVRDQSGAKNTVALLDNTEVATRTSLASPVVAVDDQALYLQAGWVGSSDGNAFLGRRWFGETLPKTPLYNFVASEVRRSQWNWYAGVATPPAGATKAEIWLLNTKTTGQAFFDDVMFLKIDIPGKVKQK